MEWAIWMIAATEKLVPVASDAAAARAAGTIRRTVIDIINDLLDMPRLAPASCQSLERWWAGLCWLRWRGSWSAMRSSPPSLTAESRSRWRDGRSVLEVRDVGGRNCAALPHTFGLMYAPSAPPTDAPHCPLPCPLSTAAVCSSHSQTTTTEADIC